MIPWSFVNYQRILIYNCNLIAETISFKNLIIIEMKIEDRSIALSEFSSKLFQNSN